MEIQNQLEYSSEAINQQLTTQVEKLHQALWPASPSEHHRNTNRLDNLNRSLDGIMSCYQRIPSDHHLEIEVTPRAYYTLGGQADFPWLNREKTKTRIRYILQIGKFVQQNQVPPGKTVLNLAVISNPDELPRFSLQQVSKVAVGRGDVLDPEDLLNIQLAPDRAVPSSPQLDTEALELPSQTSSPRETLEWLRRR